MGGSRHKLRALETRWRPPGKWPAAQRSLPDAQLRIRGLKNVWTERASARSGCSPQTRGARTLRSNPEDCPGLAQRLDGLRVIASVVQGFAFSAKLLHFRELFRAQLGVGGKRSIDLLHIHRTTTRKRRRDADCECEGKDPSGRSHNRSPGSWRCFDDVSLPPALLSLVLLLEPARERGEVIENCRGVHLAGSGELEERVLPWRARPLRQHRAEFPPRSLVAIDRALG